MLNMVTMSVTRGSARYVTYMLTMVFLFQASRTFCADAKRMTAGMTAAAPGAEAVPA